MITIAVLNFNRPEETELCLRSIKANAQFRKEVVLLNNGGEDYDRIFSFYKEGLIDKITFRQRNSGCGLGTRELFNDFNLHSEWFIYVQCDQFLGRIISEPEINSYVDFLRTHEDYLLVDLAGNQGHGKYSERAHLINKIKYQKIPNSMGGPGPFADHKWTEESVQEYIAKNNLKILHAKPAFADNGKISIRDYPCGGRLTQYTDTKAVFINKPISQRVDFPNVKLTDAEWELILTGCWIDGTIPIQHSGSSFTVWNKPLSVNDFK